MDSVREPGRKDADCINPEYKNGNEFKDAIVELIRRRGYAFEVEKKISEGSFHGQDVVCDIFIEDIGCSGAVVEVKFQDEKGTAFEKLYAIRHKYEKFNGNIYVVLGGIEVVSKIKELRSRHSGGNIWFFDYGGFMKYLRNDRNSFCDDSGLF